MTVYFWNETEVSHFLICKGLICMSNNSDSYTVFFAFGVCMLNTHTYRSSSDVSSELLNVFE